MAPARMPTICCMRRAVEREQKREHEAEINGDAAEQRNGPEMDFARAGIVHHPVTQREAANRDREEKRSDERDGKGDQIGRDGHRRNCGPPTAIRGNPQSRPASFSYDSERAPWESRATSSMIATKRSSSLTLAYLSAVSRARRPISASLEGSPRSSRIAAATAAGSSGISRQAASGFDDDARRIACCRGHREHRAPRRQNRVQLAGHHDALETAASR